MFSLNFWKQAIERAVKTGAQFVLGAGFGVTIDVLNADWLFMFGAFGTGALLSILTSMATSGFGESDSPSAVAIASAPPEPPA